LNYSISINIKEKKGLFMATILAVFAHPDDETFICGGTLAKYAKEGHQVILVSATSGEMGRRMGVPPTATRESIPHIRSQELKEACEALQIEDLRLLGIRDKLVEIQPLEQLTNTVLAHMVDVQPDVVITFHDVLGGHPDHCAIGLATTKAFQKYEHSSTIHKNVDLFYLCWPSVAHDAQHFGLDEDQIIEIDVEAYNRYKLQAFRAHRTQTEMDEWVWKRDEESIKKFGKYEYFIKVYTPFYGHSKSLIR
jgi:N-acetylglucosamine malate deacetylase 2